MKEKKIGSNFRLFSLFIRFSCSSRRPQIFFFSIWLQIQFSTDSIARRANQEEVRISNFFRQHCKCRRAAKTQPMAAKHTNTRKGAKQKIGKRNEQNPPTTKRSQTRIQRPGPSVTKLEFWFFCSILVCLFVVVRPTPSEFLGKKKRKKKEANTWKATRRAGPNVLVLFWFFFFKFFCNTDSVLFCDLLIGCQPGPPNRQAPPSPVKRQQNEKKGGKPTDNSAKRTMEKKNKKQKRSLQDGRHTFVNTWTAKTKHDARRFFFHSFSSLCVRLVKLKIRFSDVTHTLSLSLCFIF